MKRGVTLLEVLIAVMVGSIGLLAAITVFPAAMSQIRKGKLADVTAVAGESAIAAFDAQGMRERENWRCWDVVNGQPVTVPPNFQQSGQLFYGRAFCIDPMSFAHNLDEDRAAGTNNSARWSWFPAVDEAGAGNNAVTNASRMYRLSLYGGSPSLNVMTYLHADKAFRIEDELIYERPQVGTAKAPPGMDDFERTSPAHQLYTQMNGKAGRRQEEGRLTWFATLVPKLGPGISRSAGERFSPPFNQSDIVLSSEYVLSIAVCRDRAGEALHVNGSGGPTQHPWNEWTAKILPNGFHGAGVGGGEVTITTNDPADDATFNDEPYLGLRRGSWILLGRTIPTATTPIQHFQWYRVSDADETEPAGNRWQQNVTLVGGDWPTDVSPADGTAEACDVVIVPQVVHIYERTVKIAP